MMKNLIIFPFLFLCASLFSQKYIQVFTKDVGGQIAISLADLAYAAPSGVDGGSVLMTGPTPKPFYVTDTLQTIVDSSAGMLVLLDEVFRGTTREVAISKQHVKEVIPSGANTVLKLRSPMMTVTIADSFSIVSAALAASAGGGGGGDGNGIYDGGGTIPVATLATVTESLDSYQADFGFGVFPLWPEIDSDTLQSGYYYGRSLGKQCLIYSEGDLRSEVSSGQYSAGISQQDNATGASGSVGASSGSVNASVYDGAIGSTNLALLPNRFTASVENNTASDFYSIKIEALSGLTINHNATTSTITTSASSPEGAVTANVGSLHIQTAATAKLWFKQTGSGNTGWKEVTLTP